MTENAELDALAGIAPFIVGDVRDRQARTGSSSDKFGGRHDGSASQLDTTNFMLERAQQRIRWHDYAPVVDRSQRAIRFHLRRQCFLAARGPLFAG